MLFSPRFFHLGLLEFLDLWVYIKFGNFSAFFSSKVSLAAGAPPTGTSGGLRVSQFSALGLHALVPSISFQFGQFPLPCLQVHQHFLCSVLSAFSLIQSTSFFISDTVFSSLELCGSFYVLHVFPLFLCLSEHVACTYHSTSDVLV